MESNTRPIGIKSILHVLFGLAAFFATFIVAGISTSLRPQSVGAIISTVLHIGLLIFILSLYRKKVLRISLRDCRICKPQKVVVWIICAIMLPLSVACFFIFFASGNFAVSSLTAGQIINQIFIGFFFWSVRAAITEEVLFRGFIMPVLEIRWGKAIAILVPSILFALTHLLNMENFSFISVMMLIVSGTSVGVMFSLITYQSGSIWPSAIVHCIWNLFFLGGILSIGASHGETDIITYTLHSNSILLTGGEYGAEASVPAIAGYIIVIFIALVLCKKAAKPK